MYLKTKTKKTLMLNIFKQKNKILNNKQELDSVHVKSNQNLNSLTDVKHFPPATQEWFNSIYVYNKTYTKFLPSLDNMVIKLTKYYFNLHKKVIQKKISKRALRLRLKLKRLSTNNIFVSRAELKHTNSKIAMTLYIYDEQQRFLLDKLKKTSPLRKRIKKSRKNFFKLRKANRILWMSNNNFKKKIMSIKLKGLRLIKRIRAEKSLMLLSLDSSNYVSDRFKMYETLLYKDFIKKSLKKEMLNVSLMHKIYLNKSKFRNSSLLLFNKLLNKIYNKKVQLNVVNLKYLYLNSDIFMQSIVVKLKNRKNRLLRVLKKSLSLVKLSNKNVIRSKDDIKCLDTVSINSDKMAFRYKDTIQIALSEVFNKDKTYTNSIESKVLNSLKYKSINGVRLEASGRLSKRFTASRSVFKFKYIGSLKNIDSSYNNLSTVILRGHLKSNIQYTNINSKTRNGSFGLKGWISNK